MLPVFLAIPYEQPLPRPLLWADWKFKRHKFGEAVDRVALNVPVGYTFGVHSRELDEEFPFYIVQREGVRGSVYHITPYAEFLGNGARTYEDFCEEKYWESVGARWRVVSFEDRFIAGVRACGFSVPQVDSSDAMFQQWGVCREDGCWEIAVYGDSGENWLSGELLEVLDTIRFVPLPSPEPDFVLRR
ncbi:MAG: hypothetical protein Q4D96_07810 [Propionibacteriaceae bacterium]|nr:hypothetical protein [Propionibacteriaceae bacterium]